MTTRFRVVTYNVHRCRGMDGRVRPQRIVDVLREVDADVIALQEVVNVADGAPHEHQGRFIADELGMEWALGENRQLYGGAYGNVLLSKKPLRVVCNHDISVRGRERRGCLHTDVFVREDKPLHVFNVHLGTAFLERRHQARRLTDPEILLKEGLAGPRIVMGDFNEWTTGLATELLNQHLKSVDVKKHLGWAKTFPGLMPVMHLDHIYFDEPLELASLKLHRTRTALMASDHLPLAADFEWRNGASRD